MIENSKLLKPRESFYRERHTCGYEQKLDLVKLPVIVAKYMTLLEEVK